ncbi:aminoglycoside phosphotransferase family protein [Gilvimarinus sp. F26214L]|uniref:aminoglycoside phosphotransferase family protein n=1 Tax=Gilvimarinus sp. DZF01 TaxID=3461371 RepID=UPI0040465CDF
MQTNLVAPLSEWLTAVMPSVKLDELALKPLSGDAGARRYYRIEPDPERLAVYAPPETEDSKTFVALADYLRQQGIHAPKVHAADFERGFLLIDNLGERLYLGDLSAGSVDALYGEALMTLLRLQQSPPSVAQIPPYSREKLLQELRLFPEWFMGHLLGYTPEPWEQEQMGKVFEALIDSALEQPACFVHRDYHSRNLIHRQFGPPGVIDFQDAVWGPFTYDLVSLLRDCYVRWPRESVERWALAYANMAQDVGIAPADMTAQQFLGWFDLMGLQRHLKVLGIFARLALRDEKPGYLNDLPLVIRYVVEVLDAHPQFAAFSTWFKDRLIPLAAEHSWYTDYRTAGYTPA